MKVSHHFTHTTHDLTTYTGYCHIQDHETLQLRNRYLYFRLLTTRPLICGFISLVNQFIECICFFIFFTVFFTQSQHIFQHLTLQNLTSSAVLIESSITSIVHPTLSVMRWTIDHTYIKFKQPSLYSVLLNDLIFVSTIAHI